MIWTSDGSPATPSRTSLIAVVTSSVLASGFLETATPIPGLPLVREILLGLPLPRVTSATSDSRTTPDSEAPTTRSLTSWTESNVWVVLAMTACVPSKTTPAGSVRLFSLRAAAIWKREIPVDASLSTSATTLDAPFHLPGQHDLHDAFDFGDCRQDAGLNDALDLRNVPVRDDAELYDGDLVGVEAANCGLFHSRGESGVVHGGGDSALRFRHVRAVLEGSEDGGVALERRRLCRFQTRSIGNGPLYRSGDVLNDGLGVCRWVGCEYGNEGELDLGEQLDLKRAVGEYA